MSREQTAWDWWQPPPAKDSDTAISPQWIADWLGDWTDLDPCAHPLQLVQARVMITEGGDGLLYPWCDTWRTSMRNSAEESRDVYFDRRAAEQAERWLALRRSPRVWCNMPYSRPMPWVSEGTVALRDGASVVWFMRADLTTKWARLALEAARDHGGWAGLTRARCPHGAVSPAQPNLPVVWPKGSGWAGHLMVATGPDVLAPPRERLWMIALDRPDCVPLRTTG